MVNRELATIFYAIADILDADRVAFKPLAYRKAALALESAKEDAADIYAAGGVKSLEDIPGVGKSIAQKIEEYVKTGKIKYYEKLKRSLPVDLGQITAIEGVGPKRAKILYQKLAIKNMDDLERAAVNHKIAELVGFGAKSEQNILQGIGFQRRSLGRFLLGELLPRARQIQNTIEEFGIAKQIEMGGSLRRRKETIGDIDFLAILGAKAKKSDAVELMDRFTALSGIEKIWGVGATKASVRMVEGFDVDLRVLPKKSFGAALQYFTGSKEHNIALRRIAIEKGLKLSEYGLFKGSAMLPSSSEEEIYQQLGLEFVPPELRENQGEVEAARHHDLPDIIGYNSLRGDLHCHSDWDGGENSIEELANAAIAKGYEYIGIADHTKFLKIERGLDEKKLRKRNVYIDSVNLEFAKQGKNFKIFKGCEANILPDGSIDIDDSALAELDFVIAGIHSSFKMDKQAMTQRMMKAMSNPNVDIISHPTGRLLKKRDEYSINMEKIFIHAKQTKTILEINSYPERLDLNDHNIRRAGEYGIKMVIDTDAHSVDHLRFAEYGIAQARRGWATANDIINTFPARQLEKFFKQ